jgi:hypothetical protein
MVARGRIDACLAVSRAFGDGSYKTNKELKPQQQKVSPEPEMFETRIGPKDFLFICCDGIYESFSNEKAIEFIRERLKNGEKDSAVILSDLLTQVLQKGSKDNMTAMLVQLKNGTSFNRGDEFIAGEWYEGGNDTFQAAYQLNCEWYGKTTEEAKAAWLERKKKLAAQKAKDRKEGKSVSDSSSSSEELDPEPKAADKEGSQGGGGGGGGKKDIKRATVDSSSSGDEGKEGKEGKKSSALKKKNPLGSSSNTTTSPTGKRSSKDKKSLTWFAKKFGGPTAREAIVGATGLVHTGSKDSSSESPGTPKEGSQLGRSKPAKK